MPDRETGADELYVGYLPVPQGQRRFLRLGLPLVLWVACGATFLWARSQHSPGTGAWDQGQPMRLMGVLVAAPYPMLFAQGPDGHAECVLLVEVGKHGGRHDAAALDGRWVAASGWPLHRDGRRILELEPQDGALSAASDAGEGPVAPPARVRVGTVTLRGEIMDSKCFLGAMKPGEGKTHKECATLCIRGGIPPVLVTRDAAGNATYTLLESPGGGKLGEAAHAYIADPVEVRGELFQQGDMRILELDAKAIRRL